MPFFFGAARFLAGLRPAAALAADFFGPDLVFDPRPNTDSQPDANFSVLPVCKTVTINHLYARVVTARRLLVLPPVAPSAAALSFHSTPYENSYTTALRSSTHAARFAAYGNAKWPRVISRVGPFGQGVVGRPTKRCQVASRLLIAWAGGSRTRAGLTKRPGETNVLVPPYALLASSAANGIRIRAQ